VKLFAWRKLKTWVLMLAESFKETWSHIVLSLRLRENSLSARAGK
jgi:hypothetical protein